MTTKIQKWGNSLAIRIPKEFAESLKLKAGIAILGIALLFLINILRVYFVLLAGKLYGIQTAELVHTASWLAMTAIIIAIWYYLTKKLSGKKFEELI